MSLTPISAEEVTQRATAPLIVGETVDLSERVVTEPLVMSGARLANVDFSGSHFKAPVTCADTEFAGLAWFRRCRFDQGVLFERVVFENDCRLDHTICSSSIVIEGCDLRGVGSFDHCHVEGDLAVRHSVVLGNMSMSQARIQGSLDLRASQLLGGLWLDHAVLVQGLLGEQAEVHGRLWLRRAALGARGGGLASFGYSYT